jgi:hypothetical protein
MRTSLMTLDTILRSLDGFPHLRRVCDCMFRYTVPDIHISTYVPLYSAARYGEDLGDFAYRILRVQYEGVPMTYVELTVLNYGFYQLATVREMIQDEELRLLNAAVKPIAMQSIDRSRSIHLMQSFTEAPLVAL